jgi:YD repeat-containing protein
MFMKILLTILLLALASAGAQAQESKQETALIQSIRFEKAKLEKKSGKWLDGKRTLSSIQTFDDAGRLVESVIHKDGGDLYVKYAARFDTNGLKSEETYYDAKGAVLEKTVYQYDGSRKLIGKLHFGAGGKSAGESSVLYKNGRISEVIRYSGKTSAPGRRVYTYQDSEHKVEIRRYSATGFIGGEIMGFDGQGLLRESITYKLDAADGDRWVYQYDKEGNLIEETLSIAGQGAIRWRHAYELDAQGRWVKQTISLVTTEKSGETILKPVESNHRIISYRAEAGHATKRPNQNLAEAIASNVTETVLAGSLLNTGAFMLPFRGRLTGQIEIFLIINELGKVTMVVPHGHLTGEGAGDAERLRDVLEDIAKDWKFGPTVKGGLPISTGKAIPFTFSDRPRM